jgi:hypothetical protein
MDRALNKNLRDPQIAAIAQPSELSNAKKAALLAQPILRFGARSHLKLLFRAAA